MSSEIVPDDKDWTWVLERPCDECGFDAGAVVVTEVADAIRDNARRWWAVLTAPGGSVGLRPSAGRWSPLEYGAHVRDVYRLYEQRLRLMLDTDDPVFANWDQDETAVADRYDRQDPAVVADELSMAAATIATTFETVEGDQWERRGRRSDGAAFTIASFARYLLHDPVHHLWDVDGRAGRNDRDA